MTNDIMTMARNSRDAGHLQEMFKLAGETVRLTTCANIRAMTQALDLADTAVREARNGVETQAERAGLCICDGHEHVPNASWRGACNFCGCKQPEAAIRLYPLEETDGA